MFQGLRGTSKGPPAKPHLDIKALLATPTWSVRSLLPDPEAPPAPDDEITPKKLHHLLRLSALPLPKSKEEEDAMLATLHSQLHFVRDIQKVNTDGVRPLQSIRDETPEGMEEITIDMESLKEAFAKEEIKGRNKRPRRKRAEARLERVPGVEDWDPLSTAKEIVERGGGRYFIVRSGKGTPTEKPLDPEVRLQDSFQGTPATLTQPSHKKILPVKDEQTVEIAASKDRRANTAALIDGAEESVWSDMDEVLAVNPRRWVDNRHRQVENPIIGKPRDAAISPPFTSNRTDHHDLIDPEAAVKPEEVGKQNLSKEPLIPKGLIMSYLLSKSLKEDLEAQLEALPEKEDLPPVINSHEHRSLWTRGEGVLGTKQTKRLRNSLKREILLTIMRLRKKELLLAKRGIKPEELVHSFRIRKVKTLKARRVNTIRAGSPVINRNSPVHLGTEEAAMQRAAAQITEMRASNAALISELRGRSKKDAVDIVQKAISQVHHNEGLEQDSLPPIPVEESLGEAKGDHGDLNGVLEQAPQRVDPVKI